MVEIYLIVNGTQIKFLSIPLSDVERLSIRPFKWLRFVMFCVCGARGDLAALPDGPPVDYGTHITELADVTYYYKASEEFVFVDPYCLNERITSTPHRSRFRSDVIARDGEFCVVTGHALHMCDTAHLIPRSKGDEYIRKVVHDRSPHYEPASQSSISGIDDVVNGVLVGKHLHAMLYEGDAAFLKTPGFGLEADDIPRVPRVSIGATGTDRITLHCLFQPRGCNARTLEMLTSIGETNPSVYFSAGVNVDAAFNGTGISPPSAVILDYIYGVAAYNLWGVDPMFGVVQNYFDTHYKHFMRDQQEDDGTDPVEDDPSDPDYVPDASQTTIEENQLEKAMDKLNYVMMYLKGILPEEAANRWQRRLEEKERMAQEASRIKVMEWMRATDVNSS